jgi:hypothetical protein
MKITFKEILDNKKEWIHEELLESVHYADP